MAEKEQKGGELYEKFIKDNPDVYRRGAKKKTKTENTAKGGDAQGK